MRRISILILVITFTANINAIEPFVAHCESKDMARRYDGGNAKTILGDRMNADHYGWKTEHWWGEDVIGWTGGETLSLNNGKLVLRVIQAGSNYI